LQLTVCELCISERISLVSNVTNSQLNKMNAPWQSMLPQWSGGKDATVKSFRGGVAER